MHYPVTKISPAGTGSPIAITRRPSCSLRTACGPEPGVPRAAGLPATGLLITPVTPVTSHSPPAHRRFTYRGNAVRPPASPHVRRSGAVSAG